MDLTFSFCAIFYSGIPEHISLSAGAGRRKRGTIAPKIYNSKTKRKEIIQSSLSKINALSLQSRWRGKRPESMMAKAYPFAGSEYRKSRL
jgi:hypothetical protein